jgi:hypothetical protein
MLVTFSYASLLQALGRLLDQIKVKSFAIKEEEDGLLIEGFNSQGQLQVQLRYDIAGLYNLMQPADDTLVQHDVPTSGVLHRFLVDHQCQLVGEAR